MPLKRSFIEPGADSSSPEDDSTIKGIEEGWGDVGVSNHGDSSSDNSSSSSAEGVADLKGFREFFNKCFTVKYSLFESIFMGCISEV